MDERVEDLERQAAKAAELRRSPGFRSARKAMAEDRTLNPFSLRLSADEVFRLRAESRAQGLKPTELALRLLAEGLDRLALRRSHQLRREVARNLLFDVFELIDLGERDLPQENSGTSRAASSDNQGRHDPVQASPAARGLSQWSTPL